MELMFLDFVAHNLDIVLHHRFGGRVKQCELVRFSSAL